MVCSFALLLSAPVQAVGNFCMSAWARPKQAHPHNDVWTVHISGLVGVAHHSIGAAPVAATPWEAWRRLDVIPQCDHPLQQRSSPWLLTAAPLLTQHQAANKGMLVSC
jgi:hypothetical protein